MFERIAKRIADTMADAGQLNGDETELYAYGLFIALSHAFFLVFAVTLGFILRIPGEAAIFFTVFCLVRSFAGGIHARTEGACTVSTVVLIAVFETLIRLSSLLRTYIPFYAILVLCSAVLTVFGPVGHPNKPLEARDRRRYKTVVSVMTLFFSALAAASFITGALTSYGAAVTAGTVFAAALRSAEAIRRCIYRSAKSCE